MLALKLLACGAAVFILLAVVVPNLVDMHRDLALSGAVLSVALALLIGAVGARAALSDSRKIAEARRRSLLPPL